MNIDNLEKVYLKNSELKSAVFDYIESNKESHQKHQFSFVYVYHLVDSHLVNSV